MFRASLAHHPGVQLPSDYFVHLHSLKMGQRDTNHFGVVSTKTLNCAHFVVLLLTNSTLLIANTILWCTKNHISN